MQIFRNRLQALHDARLEMYRGRLVPCHEKPARVDHVLSELGRRPVGVLLDPAPQPDGVLRAALEAVHAPRYLDFLASAWDAWLALDPANAEQDILPSVWPVRGFRSDVLPDNFAARLGLFSFDAGSPIMAGTWAAAQQGAACTHAAALAVAAGSRSAFALTRPPGHHAGPDFFGGYCFVNNAALAAQTLRHAGATRVAVLDVDYHHGNGTQTIFWSRPDVLTVSVHGDPRSEYPFFLGHADEHGEGEGLGANLNLPLPRGSSVAHWFAALEAALQAVQRHGADALVVALGVDTFEGDPISGFRLTGADYLRLGERLARAGLPTVFTFEGGYAVAEVGVNVVNVLEGFVGAG
ncbi:MAG TPA: histone deacetylase family protein [Burkholderiaceae bacterium]|nr:histone deacetylase family protein [Burkholderiaceae bacterium]